MISVPARGVEEGVKKSEIFADDIYGSPLAHFRLVVGPFAAVFASNKAVVYGFLTGQFSKRNAQQQRTGRRGASCLFLRRRGSIRSHIGIEYF